MHYSMCIRGMLIFCFDGLNLDFVNVIGMIECGRN